VVLSETTTRLVVERLYEAYFAGNAEGMLAEMAPDVEVRFLGRGSYHGIAEARHFFTANTGMLLDLDFRILRRVVDGEWAAVLWEETATTIHDDPYANHGVDVFRVERGRITVLHENNDVGLHREAFDRPAI
jgi:ketosteroid isomerase-like protein